MGNLHSVTRRQILLAAGLSMLFAGAAGAQSFPAKPLNLVVPFAAGGTSDVLARAMARGMSEALGQNVVVVNRAGAGGTLGLGTVAKAPADGYTMGMGGLGSVVFAAGIYGAKLTYNPRNELAALAPVATVPTLIAVRTDSPIGKAADLVDLARKQPGKLRFGSAGLGGTLHIAGELFKKATATDLVHVPYKGGVPAITDLLGGQIELIFSDVTLVQSHVAAGKLRVVALASDARSPYLPDIATLKEAGIAGVAVDTWYALVVPAGSPTAVLERLRAAAARASGTADTRQLLKTQGLTPIERTPREFESSLAAEYARWVPLVQDVCRNQCD